MSYDCYDTRLDTGRVALMTCRLRGNIVFVPQIPKSPAGKILRRLLKDTKGVEHVLYKKKQLPTTSKL